MVVACPQCSSKVGLSPADVSSNAHKMLRCGSCGVEFDIRKAMAVAQPVVAASAGAGGSDGLLPLLPPGPTPSPISAPTQSSTLQPQVRKLPTGKHEKIGDQRSPEVDIHKIPTGKHEKIGERRSPEPPGPMPMPIPEQIKKSPTGKYERVGERRTPDGPGPMPSPIPSPLPDIKKIPTGKHDKIMERSPDPEIKKIPTGRHDKVVERTPDPEIKKIPTGKHEKVDYDPDNIIRKIPTGKHDKVEGDRKKGDTADSISRSSRRLPKKIADYEILEEINRGGMGIVYKARDSQLRRLVAIKVLLAGEGATEEDVKRFQREAQATARLQHSNIVPIYAVGTHDGKPYFVMDFIEGKTAKQLKEEGRISPRLALSIIEGVAEALHHAHLSGVVHRDVKPGNILVDKFERAQLMDFGLARRVDEDLDITQAGTTMGTPSYMAPEQAEGKLDQVDAQSDLYSAGACLYELLTGQPPFDGPTIMAVLRKVVDENPVPPRQINPKIHRDVETICMKCLEKDKLQRYQTCKALAEDIRRFNMGEAIAAKPLGAIPTLFRKARRHKEVTLAGLVVVLAIFAAIGWTINQAHEVAQEQIRQQRDKLDTALFAARKQFKNANDNLEELESVPRAAFESQSEVVQTAINKAVTLFRQAEALAPDNSETREGLENLRKLQTNLDVRGFVFRARAFLNPVAEAADGRVDPPNFSGAEFAAKEALKRDPGNKDATKLLRQAIGIRTVSVEALGAPAEVFARKIMDGARRPLAGDADDKGPSMGMTPLQRELEPGLYILTLTRKDAGAQQVTMWVSRESQDDELQAKVVLATPEANMVVIQEGSVVMPQVGATKVSAFLIDRYEFPNRAGVMPETNISPIQNYSAAREKCAAAGKKVCSSAQWLRACMGNNDRRYPYGAQYAPGKCAAGYPIETQRRPFVSGYFTKCHTPDGVYDMSGNVAEWTASDPGQDTQTEVVYGGDYSMVSHMTDLTVSCRARQLSEGANPDQLGFRCCKAK